MPDKKRKRHCSMLPNLCLIVCFVMIVNGNTFAQNKTTIVDYYKLFPHKILTAKEDDYTSIYVDEKNAFLSIDYRDPNYGDPYVEYVDFTYFVNARKEKIFGHSYYFDSPSSEVIYSGFYTYNRGIWKKADVLPSLSLNDFLTKENVDDSRVVGHYRLRYKLPQSGTDVIVTVCPVGESDGGVASYQVDEHDEAEDEELFDGKIQSSGSAYGFYYQFIKSLSPRILEWDRDSSRFVLRPR